MESSDLNCGILSSTSRQGRLSFLDEKSAVQYSRTIGPRQKRVCPSASHSGLSGGTGTLFFPPVSLPISHHNGGSTMEDNSKSIIDLVTIRSDFYLHLTRSEDGTLLALGCDGWILPKYHWETYREALDRFYSSVSEEEIASHNIVWEIDESRKSAIVNVIGETSGHVYLIGCPEGYCKIGRTKHLSTRLLALGLQLPFRVELLHSIAVSDPVWAERFLHKKLSHCRANGEWFLLTAEDIQWIKSLSRLEPGDQ